MSGAMLWVVCVPLLGAAAAFVARGRATPAIGMICTASLGPAVWWIGAAVAAEGPQRYAIGGWAAPLGIGWYVDGLSVVMLGATAGVSLLIAVYALSFYGSGAKAGGGGAWSERQGFWPLWLMLLGSLNALLLSADIFNLYVCLELLTLAAVGLVTLSGEARALTGAMRYLLAAMVGSLLYLLGVGLLYGQHGALDLYLLGTRVHGGAATWVAMGLMTVGLMLKTALFPLHFWLPPAHANAQAPVSAVLSGLVVKASFYVLLRLWFEVFGELVHPAATQFAGLLGAAAIIGGSVQAILQRRLKMLIAYSTVAQIGYLFLLIPLAAPFGAGAWQQGAWVGGIYHMVSHAFAKAAMFLAAGSIIVSIGSDRIRRLRGMATQMPITTFTFALAGINLIGLPPSGGFLAKWLLVTAAIQTGQWWWAVVVLVGGLLAAAYVFLVLRYAFLPPAPPHFQPAPRVAAMAGLALALVAMVLGLRAAEVFEMLRIGRELTAPEGP